MFSNIFVYAYPCMHAITINERAYEFENKKRGVNGQVQKEEKEGRIDVIIANEIQEKKKKNPCSQVKVGKQGNTKVKSSCHLEAGDHGRDAVGETSSQH